MKKCKKIVAIFCAIAMMLGTFVACGGDDESSSSSSSASSSSSSSLSSSSSSSSSTPPVVVPDPKPTAAKLVQARAKVLQDEEQSYDFTMKLGGNITVLGMNKYMEAKYDGAYRYNKASGAFHFKRETSGELLVDSTQYAYNQNDNIITITMKPDGTVKKVQVVAKTEEESLLINKPIVALIDHMQESEIANIVETGEEGYAYQADLHFSAENEYLNKLFDVVGGLGSNISFKGVTITNPIAGMKMLFNISQDRLEDFKLTLDVSVPIASAEVNLQLTYEQAFSGTEVSIPATTGIVTTSQDIAAKLGTVQSALNSVKAQEDYSLDLLAKNELDPAWNKTATVDSYIGRLYKNTVDSNVWFNHSYKYKAHHEEDGQEAYEYAIGNITDGRVYSASYKGDNIYTVINDKTVDTQFDYMTSSVFCSVENIDCARVTQVDGNDQYIFYLNKSGAQALQSNILNMINSNTAEGVIPVNNYMASDYTVQEAEIIVTMKNGAIVNIECLTEIQYNPTGGEYTEYNVTLTNTIQLTVNENLDKAQEYEAPSKGDGFLTHLKSVL